MSEDLFDSLEDVLEKEPFVIIDTCTLESKQSYDQEGFLAQTYGYEDRTQLPTQLIEKQLELAIRQKRITEKPNTRVTLQVRDEIERYISKIQRVITHKTTAKHGRHANTGKNSWRTKNKCHVRNSI